MSHFAQIENGIVINVIVAEQDYIDTISGTWVQTSYNTRGGIYYIPNSNPPEPGPDQSLALRANYAGIGYTFDITNDVFYAPKPDGDGWTISAPTWLWVDSNPSPVTGTDTVRA